MLNKLKARGLGWLLGGVALGLMGGGTGRAEQPAETNQLAQAIKEQQVKALTDAANMQMPLTPTRFSSNSGAMDAYNRQQQARLEAIKDAQRLLLTDPNNLDAKLILAGCYYTDLDDPGQRARGQQLFEELAASTNVAVALRANNALQNDIYVPDKNGRMTVVKAPRPKPGTGVLPVFSSRPPHKKEVPPESAAQLPPFQLVDTFPAGKAQLIFDHGQLLMARGAELFQLNEAKNHFEKIALPVVVQHPIIALAADEDSWWLGTEGGGLVRISKAGRAARTYTEAEGLMMPAVSALCRSGDRLWVGFGFRQSGGLGYLDLKTDKFVGLTADIPLFKSPKEASVGPPDAKVYTLLPADDRSVWVDSGRVLRRYDSTTSELLQAVPAQVAVVGANPNCLVVNGKYNSLGVRLFSVASNQWQDINFIPAQDVEDVEATALSVCMAGRFAWVGGTGKIRLVDTVEARVVAEYRFREVREVKWVGKVGDKVWFVGDAWGRDRLGLYHFTVPPLPAPGAPGDASAQAEALYNLGMVAFQRRHLDFGYTARQAFLEALRLNPASKKSKLMLADILLQSCIDAGYGWELLADLAASESPAFVAEAQHRQMSYSNIYYVSAHYTNPPPETGALTVKLPKPTVMLHRAGMTAVSPAGEDLLIASKRMLYRYGVAASNIPVNLKHPITAVAGDAGGYWLGTQGGGLVRVTKSGELVRVYDERDGLFMPSISALCLSGGQLWVGFGGYRGNEYGGLGRLDLTTGKFYPLTRMPALKKLSAPPAESPDTVVTAIETGDDKTMWVASDNALHRYEVGTQKWSVALPFGPLAVTVNSNHVVASDPSGGLMVCDLPGSQWRKIDLAPRFTENLAYALRFEGNGDSLLWTGNERTFSLIDVSTSHKLGEIGVEVMRARNVRWIYPRGNELFLLTDTGADFGLSQVGEDVFSTETTLLNLYKPVLATGSGTFPTEVRPAQGFVGRWSGRWDGKWAVHFTVTAGVQAGQYEVLYEWQNTASEPLQQSRVSATAVGDVLRVGRSIEITLVPGDTNRGSAIGNFEARLKAELVRD